jgi:hypothetical protein
VRTLGRPGGGPPTRCRTRSCPLPRRRSYRGEARVTTWLHRIVVNACLDAGPPPRRAGDGPAAEQERADPRDVLAARETALRSRPALAPCPSTSGTAIVLVDVQGAAGGRGPPRPLASGRHREEPLLAAAGPAAPHAGPPAEPTGRSGRPTGTRAGRGARCGRRDRPTPEEDRDRPVRSPRPRRARRRAGRASGTTPTCPPAGRAPAGSRSSRRPTVTVSAALGGPALPRRCPTGWPRASRGRCRRSAAGAGRRPAAAPTSGAGLAARGRRLRGARHGRGGGLVGPRPVRRTGLVRHHGSEAASGGGAEAAPETASRGGVGLALPAAPTDWADEAAGRRPGPAARAGRPHHRLLPRATARPAARPRGAGGVPGALPGRRRRARRRLRAVRRRPGRRGRAAGGPRVRRGHRRRERLLGRRPGPARRVPSCPGPDRRVRRRTPRRPDLRGTVGTGGPGKPDRLRAFCGAEQ